MAEAIIGDVKVELVLGDIAVQPSVDALVNAANARLHVGGGVAGAIHRAAGPGLAEECRPLAPIEPGQCVVTGGHDLPNPWVIHCLGPVYGQDEPAEELLASCYRKVLQLADEHGMTSVALPAISTGAFAYPVQDAAEVALAVVFDVAPQLTTVRLVRFVLHTRSDLEVHRAALESLQGDGTSPIELGSSWERARLIGQLWRRNGRIGWPERARGLHYWLGFEYAAMMRALEASEGSRWLDVGSGAWSPWPFLLADATGARVVALDSDPGLQRQRARRDRAARAGLRHADGVQLVQGDARSLPFPDATFDGVTAVSSLEHVQGLHGDRHALQEIARVLRPGGQALVSVPFREKGSMVELDDQFALYQRHYSPTTFQASMVQPSGLRMHRRLLYTERLPFYALTRRLPTPLNWLRRPWNTALTIALMHPTTQPGKASAILADLRKPGQRDTRPPEFK